MSHENWKLRDDLKIICDLWNNLRHSPQLILICLFTVIICGTRPVCVLRDSSVYEFWIYGFYCMDSGHLVYIFRGSTIRILDTLYLGIHTVWILVLRILLYGSGHPVYVFRDSTVRILDLGILLYEFRS